MSVHWVHGAISSAVDEQSVAVQCSPVLSITVRVFHSEVLSNVKVCSTVLNTSVSQWTCVARWSAAVRVGPDTWRPPRWLPDIQPLSSSHQIMMKITMLLMIIVVMITMLNMVCDHHIVEFKCIYMYVKLKSIQSPTKKEEKNWPKEMWYNFYLFAMCSRHFMWSWISHEVIFEAQTRLKEFHIWRRQHFADLLILIPIFVARADFQISYLSKDYIGYFSLTMSDCISSE